ncbi:MAG: dihydroneopterin aldolase [Flammeovirgaceae bacterium]|nr:dihydroneopterin aldolase [Flammeovirgaceae bacterium]
MITRIALEGLEFHAFHGVYPHERESGNYFEVDISVDAEVKNASSTDSLETTVNYEDLFRIVKNVMDSPSKLLETVGEKAIEQIFRELPTVQKVELRISKLNPPIGGKCKKATVHMIKSR